MVVKRISIRKIKEELRLKWAVEMSRRCGVVITFSVE